MGFSSAAGEEARLRLPREEFAQELGGWLEAWVEAPLMREESDRAAVQEAVRRAAEIGRESAGSVAAGAPQGAWMVVELSMDQGASWVPVRCPQRLAAPSLGAPTEPVKLLPATAGDESVIGISIEGQGLVPCDCRARLRVHGDGGAGATVPGRAQIQGSGEVAASFPARDVADGLGLLAAVPGSNQASLVSDGEPGYRLALVEVSFDGGATFAAAGGPVLLLRPGSVGGAWPALLPVSPSDGVAVVRLQVSTANLLGGVVDHEQSAEGAPPGPEDGAGPADEGKGAAAAQEEEG